MPILLDTPHTYSPGHGEPDVVNSMLMIVGFTVYPIERSVVLNLQYGNSDSHGEWVSSEPIRSMRISNIPADVRGGTNSKTGQWEFVEVSPADNVYDDMTNGFVVQESHMGARQYDVVGRSLFQWLIDNGHYSGTIV